jgi:flap endonuclease-1
MGIKNLIKLIEKYAPSAISYNKITKYENKIIAIDGNLLIYKLIYAIRFNGYDLKKGEINVTHIHALLLKIYGFIKYNITPVFVFDNIMPKIKLNTINKRREFYENTKEKYDSAKNIEDKKKYYFAKEEISDKDINDCINLIKLFNYTVIYAKEEADSELVYLLQKKLVDYIATDDTDILVFGGDNMLKNFTISDKKLIQEINLEKFKKETNLTQKKLIDLGILLGCDYCNYKMGLVTAYKNIQKYGSIEEIIKNSKINLDYIEARKYFISLPHNDENYKIKKLKINKLGLINFLMKFGYNMQDVDKILVKLGLGSF